MTYTYLRSEPALWTVGHHDPDGRWEPESDHSSSEAAAARVAWLNGSGGADPAELERLRTEVEKLREDAAKLAALENAGVDNWDGYSYAMELLNEGEASC